MKKILCLLVSALLFGSCEKEEVTWRIVFLRSYIYTYEAGPAELLFSPPSLTENGYLVLKFGFGDKSIRYGSPETGGENSDEFLKIAERNSDRFFNQEASIGPEPNPVCCADNFKTMQVVCLNAAWDDAHPAGVSLNDLMTIKYVSYNEFIRHGYNLTYLSRRATTKPLSKLAENDLSMIETNAELWFFSNPPAAPGSYEVQVTMTTTEDEEKIAACELIWK